MKKLVNGGWVTALCKGLKIPEDNFIQGKDAIFPPAELNEHFNCGCILLVDEEPSLEILRVVIRDLFKVKGYEYLPSHEGDATGMLRKPNGDYLMLAVSFIDRNHHLIFTVR